MTVPSRSYISPVSGAKPLKVYYHLVQWRSFLLVNWFCGLKATRLLSILQLNQPDRTWCICAHIFSLFSSKKLRGVSTKKPPSREECETLLEGKVGPSIALLFPLPRCCVAHKGSRQAGRNQFHGATGWKWGRERAGEDREAAWRFRQARIKNNQQLLAGLPPASLHAHSTVLNPGKLGRWQDMGTSRKSLPHSTSQTHLIWWRNVSLQVKHCFCSCLM